MTLTRYLDKRGGFLDLFIWQLRRTLPAAITYWALMVGLTLWDWFVHRGYYENNKQMEIIITGFAFALPLVHLGDCFSRRRADFIHALPASRGSFYLSALLNALWQILLPIVPCRLYTVYVPHWLDVEASAFHTSSFHIRPLVLAAVAVTCFTFMVAAASGTYHGYILAALAHLAGWRLMVNIICYMIPINVPGSSYMSADSMNLFFCIGSPVLIQFINVLYSTWLLIYLWMPIFAALCALAGYLFYKRRASEQAGHFGQCRTAELLMRTELTLLAGVVAAGGISAIARGKYWGGAGIPLTLGGTLLALLLAYIILEMVWHRSLKAARKHARCVIIPAGILAVIIGATSTGLGMDTAIPEVSQVEYVTVHTIYPFASYDINDSWNVQTLDADEDRISSLFDGVMSPGLLDKVHELHAKYIELERAAQYPYLPGRGAYGTQEYTSINYTLISRDKGGFSDRKHADIKYCGPINARTEPLLEELHALLMEILSSDEYINGMKPMVAIDAVVSLDKLTEVDEWGVVNSYGVKVEAPKALKELPKDFLEELEAAMREDFKNGCYTTGDGVYDADYPIYQLNYKGEFTARGGMLWDNEARAYVQAAGKRLKLYEDDDPEFVRNGFRVSKEMPATYALLECAYQ